MSHRIVEVSRKRGSLEQRLPEEVVAMTRHNIYHENMEMRSLQARIGLAQYTALVEYSRIADFVEWSNGAWYSGFRASMPLIWDQWYSAPAPRWPAGACSDRYYRCCWYPWTLRSRFRRDAELLTYSSCSFLLPTLSYYPSPLSVGFQFWWKKRAYFIDASVNQARKQWEHVGSSILILAKV